jgi:hypothetical protein
LGYEPNELPTAPSRDLKSKGMDFYSPTEKKLYFLLKDISGKQGIEFEGLI